MFVLTEKARDGQPTWLTTEENLSGAIAQLGYIANERGVLYLRGITVLDEVTGAKVSSLEFLAQFKDQAAEVLDRILPDVAKVLFGEKR